MATAVMWFRRDLRLGDNPALLDAVAAGRGRVTALFVLDAALLGPAGPPRRDQLAASLRALSGAIGGRLVVRRGDPARVVPAVAAEVRASSVHVTEDFGPYGRRRDRAVAGALGAVPLVPAGTPYAVPPGALSTRHGDPYRVFTPYHRAWLDHDREAPTDAPAVDWVAVPGDPLPRVTDPAGVLPAGEAAARDRWRDFRSRVDEYERLRDSLDPEATSGLSVPLKYGEIHPRALLADLSRSRGAGAAAYRRQLAWREFCADLLARHPQAAWRPIRPEFERMAYDPPGSAFAAWCEGRTGYPIVDAGMRQLGRTGVLPNRVRMVVASFLVKDLLVHWREGARWFMRRLRDGDLASNSVNWQWVAGCGADAAPYFRIFNPVAQGLRFDPDGDYVRRWVPQVRGLAGAAAHEPWRHGGAPGYPAPIVDHAEARREALRRFDRMRSGRT